MFDRHSHEIAELEKPEHPSMFAASTLFDEEDLQHLLARVRSLSPQSTLERGYAVVQRSDGKAVRKAKDVATGDSVRIRLAEDSVSATID